MLGARTSLRFGDLGLMVDIARQAITGRYRPSRDPVGGDCVMACSFGYRGDMAGPHQPGTANEYLARWAIARYGEKPAIAQEEIATVMERAGRPADQMIPSRTTTGGYLDTHALAVRSRELMIRNGWKTVVVVAHPFHVPRVAAVVRAIGLQPIIPEGLSAVWDADSAQSWTRSRIRWAIRELCVLPLFAIRGWLAPDRTL